MPLHLIKLSVGSEDMDDLRRWHDKRLAETGRVFHRTRMMPRRREALLSGGSIYWVIRGFVTVRQVNSSSLAPRLAERSRRGLWPARVEHRRGMRATACFALPGQGARLLEFT